MMRSIKEKEEIGKFYEEKKVAEKYVDTRFTSPSGRVHHLGQVSFINSAISKYNVRDVLEIAPGPARLGRDVLVSKCAVAVDYSLAMLNEARRAVAESRSKTLWNFLRGDAFCLPFKDSSFEMIYSFRFIRHFNFDDRKKLFSECRRVLKSGGLLIFDGEDKDVVGEMRRRAGMLEPPIYDELFTKEELRDEAQKNGFKQIKIKGNLHLPRLERRLDSLGRFKLEETAFYINYMLNLLVRKSPLEWLVLWKKVD